MGSGKIYLEVAAGVTVFILAGRYFEARAKRRSGAALRALLELGAKDVAVLRDGHGACASRSTNSSSATSSWFAPARRSPPTASSTEGTSAVDTSLLTGESVPVEVGPGDRVTGATRQRGGRLVVRGDPGGRRHRSSPRWPGWWRTRRPARPPCNGWPTASRRCSCRWSSPWRSRRSLVWLAAGAADRHGVHRRRRGADHRLPVRPRPGHADRADGRHRTRRPARHPHQGSGGARVDPHASTPSCWTRPARSPPARCPLVDVVADGRTDSAADGRLRSRTPPSTRSPGPSPPPRASARRTAAGETSPPPRGSGCGRGRRA